MSAGARLALLALAGLLILILGFLIVFGVVLRRRARESEPAPGPTPRRVTLGREVHVEGTEYVTRPRELPRALGAGGGGLEVARDDGMICPTCRREYDTGLSYCPHDARPLIPRHELHEPRRKEGSVCPSCNRSYDAGVRFCPHDATELCAVAVYSVTTRGLDRKPTGIIAKICPQCQQRYDLSATFCAKDSTELVVIN